MVKRAKEQREIVERGGPRVHITNYMDGLFEVMEIHEIVEAFNGNSSPALKAKLSRALCGPISPFDEQPKNSEARNTMFELSLAADWKMRGARLKWESPISNFVHLRPCSRPSVSARSRRTASAET